MIGRDVIVRAVRSSSNHLHRNLWVTASAISSVPSFSYSTTALLSNNVNSPQQQPPAVLTSFLNEKHSPVWTTPHRYFHSSMQCLDSVQIPVPPMGDSIFDGQISGTLKKVGDVVSTNEVIAQIETDKVTFDIRFPGPGRGKITKLLVKDGETVTVDQMIAEIDAGLPEDEAPTPSSQAAPEPPKPAEPKAAPPPPSPPKAAQQSEDTDMPREIRVPMKPIRKRVAQRLKGAQNTYAMLTTFNEIDMTALMNLRSEYKDRFVEKHGVKLGFMSAFVKGAASALEEVPAVNAVIDEDDIVYKQYKDISIAVATPKGLVVPVLRNVDQLNFAQVEAGINILGKKAREGLLSIDEMAGGSFTISNGGVYGSLLSTPIINPPQSAIMGMHSIQQRPMVIGKDIMARPMMYVALTYDHRLIDGREAVTFLKRVKEIVENPVLLLLDL